MKIVIPGGSGHVGTLLAGEFYRLGHDVVVLSRAPAKRPWRIAKWDGETLGEWTAELEGADAVINLAGQSVNCRYTADNRKAIIDSRVKSTRVIGEAIARSWDPPRVWLQASTATIYAHRYDSANDEVNGIIGGSESNVPDTWRFSIDVATAWEQAFNQAAVPLTRKVLMRSAIIMHPDRGSPFSILSRLVQCGLGGQAGDGKQFVSWIHDRDFFSAVLWLINHEQISGPVNLAAPNPLPNAEFMRILRAAWEMPVGLPAAEWMLELGAVILGTETELILKSRRVVPARLLRSGFTFQFPNWSAAAKDLRLRSDKPAF
jgi:uncharacterized protein (TIGR01777 family)